MGTPRHTRELAKLTPPRLPKIVERIRLYRELDRMRRQQPIVWIVGAPGMGKTTLVNSYVQARKLKALWYQLDAGDQDPATFFHYLNIAFQAAVPRSRLWLPHLTAEYVGGLPIFARRFFERMLSHAKAPGVVVLDNFQDLPAGCPMQQLLPQGMEALPPNVTLIVISRELPPDEWVKLRANQSMSLVLEDSLRLSDQEEQAFIALHLEKKHHAQFEQQRMALGIAKGWVAGLILLIEQMKLRGKIENAALSEDVQITFEYLAREVLGHFSKKDQDVLVESAIFPWMTGEMVATLTGNRKAKAVLDSLARRRYFTERRQGANLVFHYHPLFHAFLRAQFEQCYPGQKGKKIVQRAAQILEGVGEPGEVIELFHQAGLVDDIIRLVQAHAPTLFEQGRNETILSWLRHVPEERFDECPWLWFWQATALMVTDPVRSQALFQKGLKAFECQGEGLGQILCVTGYLESLVGSWGNLISLDEWLPKLEALLQKFPGPYPIEVEVRILAARLLLMGRPHDAKDQLDAWAWQLLDLLEQLPNGTLRALAALPCLGWLSWTKAQPALCVIANRVKSWASEKNCPTIISATAIMTEAMLALHTGHIRNAIRLGKLGLAVCEQDGLFFLTQQMVMHQVWSALTFGDWEGTKDLLEPYKQLAEHHPGVHGLQYHGTSLWLSLETQQWEQVSYHLEQGNRRIHCGGAYQEANWLVGRALVNFELGHGPQALQDLERAATVGETTGLILTNVQVKFIRAYFAFQLGDEFKGLTLLSQALATSRSTGIKNNWFWRRSIMTILCVKALENHIEVNEAREIIQKYEYRPSTPPYGLTEWPWEVQIRTFGTFAIKVGGTAVQFGRKIPRRVLALLQAIIAFGGQQIREDILMDALWPESDGDRAYRAYATALHRLRKLLGQDELIQVQDGKVSLDLYRCGVDVWAFDHLLAQAAKASKDGQAERSQDLREQARQLYHGPFLKDEDAPWIIPIRERLRSQYVMHVEILCQAWVDNGQVDEARTLFERAIKCEPKVEFLRESFM